MGLTEIALKHSERKREGARKIEMFEMQDLRWVFARRS